MFVKWLLPIDRDLHEVWMSRQFVLLFLYVPIIYQETSLLFICERYPLFLLIKNMLKWRKETDTCLTHVCRHYWRNITMKAKAPNIHFHRDLSTPSMSTDMSEVGVALFPLFWYICLSFCLSRFPFILISSHFILIFVITGFHFYIVSKLYNNRTSWK